RRILLDVKAELRARQDPLQRFLNAALEIALLAAGIEEGEQPLPVDVGDVAAIGEPRQPPDDLSGTGILAGARLRHAREDPATAGRLTRAAGAKRPGDRQRVEVRMPRRIARVGGAPD